MTKEDQILEALSGIQQDMGSLKQDVGSLKQDVSSLKQDVSSLKQDVSSLQEGQKKTEHELAELKTTVSDLKQGQQRIEIKMDKMLENQVQDVYTLVQLVHDKVAVVDNKIDTLSRIPSPRKRFGVLREKDNGKRL